MKLLPMVALLPLLSLAPAAEPAELERRLQEQERQIRQLELENSRLRAMLDGSSPVDLKKPAAVSAAEPEIYSVREGDTLSRIARRHGTTPEKLVALNQLKNAGLIRPGQKLKIPTRPSEAPTAAPLITADETPLEGTHTVKSGETLYSIARSHGLSADALTAANPGIEAHSLQVGQKLRYTLVSGGESPAGDSDTAESKPSSGDGSSGMVSNKPSVRSVSIDEEITFGEFAAKHKMATTKLNALNGLNLEARTVLAKGSELYVSAQP